MKEEPQTQPARLSAMWLRLLDPLLWFLRFVPGMRNPMKVIDTDRRISRLEAAGYFEEARALRSSALRELPGRCLGPLWRSEGEDRLYRLRDYPGALEAFENALVAMKDSVLYGVSRPGRVLHGAASAAILMGDRARAEKYYHRFVELVESLRSDPKLAGRLEWHEKALEWLKTQIQRQ